MLRADHNQIFTRWTLFGVAICIFICNDIDVESKLYHIACMYYLSCGIVVNMSIEK